MSQLSVHLTLKLFANRELVGDTSLKIFSVVPRGRDLISMHLNSSCHVLAVLHASI